jgi:hypothetical protein
VVLIFFQEPPLINGLDLPHRRVRFPGYQHGDILLDITCIFLFMLFSYHLST